MKVRRNRKKKCKSKKKARIVSGRKKNKRNKTQRTVEKERKEGHCWRELNNWDTFFYVHYMIDFPPKMLARSAVKILACLHSPMDHPVLYLYIL